MIPRHRVVIARLCVPFEAGELPLGRRVHGVPAFAEREMSLAADSAPRSVRILPHRQVVGVMIRLGRARNRGQQLRAGIHVLLAQAAVRVLRNHFGSRKNVDGRRAARDLLHPQAIAVVRIRSACAAAGKCHQPVLAVVGVVVVRGNEWLNLQIAIGVVGIAGDPVRRRRNAERTGRGGSGGHGLRRAIAVAVVSERKPPFGITRGACRNRRAQPRQGIVAVGVTTSTVHMIGDAGDLPVVASRLRIAVAQAEHRGRALHVAQAG